HVGERAPVEVRAAHAVTIEDLTATLGKRNEVMRKVPAIFDYDVSVLASFNRMIHELFGKGRNAIADPNLSDSVFGDSVPDELLRTASRNRFEKRVKDQILDLWRSPMGRGVIRKKELIPKKQRNKSEARLVNGAAGHDEKLTADIRDVRQARQTLRQESSR